MEYDGDITNVELVKRTKALIAEGKIISPDLRKMHRIVDGDKIWYYHKNKIGTAKFHKKLKEIQHRPTVFIFPVFECGESITKQEWIAQNKLTCRHCIFLEQIRRGNYKCKNTKNKKNPLFQTSRQKSDIACKKIKLIKTKEGHN